MASSPAYMEPAQLVELMRGDTRASFIILDVRDEDFFETGHISDHCRHTPSESFEEELPDVIAQVKSLDKVVVHCAFSQQRGPRAARKLAQALAAAGLLKPEVFILRGGFNAFFAAYGHDASLVKRYFQKA